jgi:SAM-dependent methyltransferase
MAAAEEMEMANPWYVKLFDEDYLRFYAATVTPEQTRADVDFMLTRLELAPGAPVLDLCCGHGRHAIELARRGCAVTGLDLSEPALARAQASAEAAGVQVRWVQSDMRQIPAEAEFEAVINWFSAFGYLESDEEDGRVLAAVQRALRPGGKLLMEMVNHAWLMRNFSPRGWTATPDGGLLLEERVFDLLSGRNTVTATFIGPGGERVVTGHNMRIYTLAELARLMSAAGLRICDTWGDVDGSPYRITSRRMIVLAEKEE